MSISSLMSSLSHVIHSWSTLEHPSSVWIAVHINKLFESCILNSICHHFAFRWWSSCEVTGPAWSLRSCKCWSSWSLSSPWCSSTSIRLNKLLQYYEFGIQSTLATALVLCYMDPSTIHVVCHKARCFKILFWSGTELQNSYVLFIYISVLMAQVQTFLFYFL